MTGRTARIVGVGGVGIVLIGGLMMFLAEDVGETGATPQFSADDRPTANSDAPVVDVRLEALQRARQDVGQAQRNLFRFQLPPAPQPQSQPQSQAPSAPLPLGPPAGPPPPNQGPTGPAPPPPIPVKFIGAVGGAGTAGQVVYFSDGRGRVFFGREGDIIEGQYRVLTVSPDSAELAYLDGRGRQTIRLSGQ
ncbi:MAG: hypothetical protein O2930_10045 [Acidobacteria bacterium]|nr:hypothetical protein [Acidobacteriota bacterium]